MGVKNLYYFISDVHLGLDAFSPELRERKFVSFLSSLPSNTKAIYLLGDIFDFWYEYKYVVPAGYVRVLGKLAELSDRGVELYFFKGNHDLWTFGYLEKEIGLKVLEQPYFATIEGKNFCLGHGDGLGKTDFGFTLIRAAFHSKILQRLFSNIHPRWAFGLARIWSKHSRLSHVDENYTFRGKDEPIYRYAQGIAKEKKIDYYIFGHFHADTSIDVENSGKMLILGEWVTGIGAAVFDGEELKSISKL